MRPEEIDRMFDELDVNGDGVVDFKEFQRQYERGNVAVPPSAGGGGKQRSAAALRGSIPTMGGSSKVGGDESLAMARSVMEIADDVCVDGSMDVTEARRFLRGTQYESFMRWLTDDKLQHFTSHDEDASGTLELGELQDAVRSYLESNPSVMMDNVMAQYQEAGRGGSGGANRANPTRNDETLNRTLAEYSSNAGGGMKQGPVGGGREEAQFLALLPLIERSPSVGDLKSLFQYYCALQEAQPIGLEMSSQKFGKLCLEAGIVDGSLNAGVVNIVFLQAIRSGKERRSRMSWDQFILGLAMVAARKFPLYPAAEALQIVLDNHVLLLARKMSGEGRLPQVSAQLQGPSGGPSGEERSKPTTAQQRPKQQAQMPGQDVHSLAYRFCELHELPGEDSKLVSIYEHYAKGARGIPRQGFLRLAGDSQLMDRHLPQKQVMVIFMTAANSKAEDATMGMQQLLDALCMIAARKFADASSRVAGTQFLMESYVLPYAAAL